MTAAPAQQNMTVAVRVRPLSSVEMMSGTRACCHVVGTQVVTIEKYGQKGQHLQSQRGSTNEYAFDLAFGAQATQAEIYAKTVKAVVPTVFDGFNATVFAYGATGAGKTHTMMGSERDDDSRNESDHADATNGGGIIPQALTDVFQLVREHQQRDAVQREADGTISTWQISVSYLEVYNEQIRDLLQPSRRNCSLREDAAKGVVHVAGLHWASVGSSDEVLELLRVGNRNRTTEPTAANKVSSRSHAVLQVHVKHTMTKVICEKPQEFLTEGRLSLIDLAGSERASKTQNRGIRLTEGANINRSLLALANCINALASNTQRRVVSRRQSDVFSMSTRNAKAKLVKTVPSGPKVQYRDSKLTHLLKTSLEGNCRLVMIANINPADACFEESHNTLKYANRAKNIKVRPTMQAVTADLTHQQRANVLEEENVKLREQIGLLRSMTRTTADGQTTPLTSHRRKRNSLLKSDESKLSRQTQRLTLLSSSPPSSSSSSSTLEQANEQLRDKNKSLERECRAMERKIHSLQIQLEQLRSMQSKPPCAVRRSSRRQSVATLPRVDENNENASPNLKLKPASKAPNRRNSLIPMLGNTQSRKRKPDQSSSPKERVKTPKRTADSTPKSDRKLRSETKGSRLEEISNLE